MPTYFQKPENALKRADEFIDVDKPMQALYVLYDVIKSKRHRTWQKTHEPIMNRYLDLCVQEKQSHMAKEGLYQYKNICQQVNVSSLNTTIRRYLQMADEKTEAARAQSHQTVLDVEDLDVLQTPESLLLATVSGEDAQDRSDRAILTPWVKFLWESYRQCLDLLRNNNRVERLYHDIAKQAFDFCLKYTRKTEFRKLCDNLRNHLRHAVEKTHTQANAVNLNNPDTLSMHLETRLAQLDAAIQMELWQEAFKAVEDIHDLIVRSKKIPRPSLLANYFEKFGLVFWKAGNKLFHAAACHKLFILITEQKKSPSQEELVRMANRVLCATLSIPIPPTRHSIDQLLESNDAEKRRRLASLLSLPAPPTRGSLVKDLLKSNVLQHVSPELKSMYQNLEIDFDPLKLSSKMTICVDFAKSKPELEQYASPMQEMTVIRLIKQVAQIYQTIAFDRLHKLAPFLTVFELERTMVQAAKNIDLPVRLDHQTRTVSFGTDMNIGMQAEAPEGPFLQHMPGEQIRNQLQYMAQALHKAMDKLALNDSAQAEKLEIKLKIIDTYRKTEKRDREKVLKRKVVIENRKEELEVISKKLDEVEHKREIERLKKIRDAEEERLKREMEEREKQRAQQEHMDIRRKEAEKRIEQLKTTDIGMRALEGLTEEELAELDTDDILQKQVIQLEKEKKELAERLKAQEKKIDYFIRAKRIEEIPLVEDNTKKIAAENREKWNQQEAERIENLKQDRDVAMQHRDRLRRILPDRDSFLDRLNEARQGDYKAKLEEYEKIRDETRRERLAERAAARKEERRSAARKARDERRQRERDEAIKKEREEKLAREREEDELRQKAEQERLAKLEMIAEKQRLKELEVEQKLAAQQQQPRAGGWREREAQKQDRWMKKDDRDERPPPSRDDDERWQRGGRDDRMRDDRMRDDRMRDDRMRDDRMRDDERRGGDDRWQRSGPPRDMGGRGGDNDRWQRGPPSSRDEPMRRGDRDDFRRGGDKDDYRKGDRDDGFRRGGDRDDFRRGNDRDDFRRGGDRESGLRRDGDRRDGDRWGRSEDSGWRGDDRRGGPPSRGGRDDFRRGPPRDEGRSEDVWRRGEATPKRADAPPRRDDPPRREEPSRGGESDGWSTVKYNK